MFALCTYGLMSNITDIIAYPPELLNFFEQVIAGSFEDIFRQVLNADPFWATTIARRFANGDLTPQEAEALRKLLLAIRIKGGNTTRLMRKLMIAIMNFLVTSCDKIDTEQAIELVPGTIETLRDDYMSSSVDDYKSGDSTSYLGAAGALLLVLKHGCLDQDEAKKVEEAYPLPHLDMVAAHHELVEHQPKKLKEKLSKFVPKLTKLLSMHQGSKTSSLMNTLASKLFTPPSDLDETSSVNDVEVVLEKLIASPSKSDEASIALANLIEHKSSVLNELNTLSTKLLSMQGGSITRCLMKKLIFAIMNFLLVSHEGSNTEQAIELVPKTVEALRKGYMSDTEETSPAAEALLLTLEYNYLGQVETDRIKESCPVTQLTMVAAHNELVEHQPKKLKEKLEEFVPSLLSLHGKRRLHTLLARIESEEEAKSDDLMYLALSLVKDYDIYNLHEDELTHDLFTDTKSRSVFDKLLRSYNDNTATLRIKLMNFTPDTDLEERRWRTATAEGAAVLGGIGLVLKNVDQEMRIKKVDPLGPFSDAGWKKGDKIISINERQYTSYQNGMSLLRAAKERGSVTLTVLRSD